MRGLGWLYGAGSQSPHDSGILAVNVIKSRSVLGVGSRRLLIEAVSRAMNLYFAQDNDFHFLEQQRS